MGIRERLDRLERGSGSAGRRLVICIGGERPTEDDLADMLREGGPIVVIGDGDYPAGI